MIILSILPTGHHPVFQHWCVRTSMRYYPHFILPMRRSRGFASTAENLVALFRLAFASTPPQNGLILLTTVSRRIIMQKAHHHREVALRALIACRHVVSGSLSSPGRGSSHLSLALLIASGRQRVLSLGRWSSRIRTHFHVLGRTQDPARCFPLSRTGLSPSVAGDSTPFC